MNTHSSVENLAHPVRIEADGVVLPGDCTIPADARGLVLFAHGSGSSRRSPRNRRVAEKFNAAGLGTLLFDLLPDEEELRDPDADRRFDIPLLAGRLLAATHYATEQAVGHGLPFGYFGSSTGAAAALRAAAESEEQPAAIVSRGGRPDLAGEALGRVRAPTLLIVGGRDEVVLDLNRHALGRLRCEKRLEVIPGATHLFEEPGCLDAVADLAVKWFGERLAPSGAPPR